MAEETTFAGLLDRLEEYLEYQRDDGVQRVEVERAVLQELAAVPDVVRGTALALMLAGLLSIAFMGFAGLGG